MGPIEIFSAPSAGGGVGGSSNILRGIGSPVGTVSATGPAFYFDDTTPTSPTVWIKSTDGSSSTDWVIQGQFSNS